MSHRSNPVQQAEGLQAARISTLVRNWWMIAVRGELAIVFGIAILVWKNTMLSTLVMLFAAYAILDGIWAVAAAIRASERRFTAWPVTLEGVVSIAIGVVAIGRPFMPRGFVTMVAVWGVVTGVLELVAALSLPRQGAGRWLMATAGASSIFLAVAILILRQAVLEEVAVLLAIYALLFGVVQSGAAFRFRLTHARALRSRAGLTTMPPHPN